MHGGTIVLISSANNITRISLIPCMHCTGTGCCTDGGE